MAGTGAFRPAAAGAICRPAPRLSAPGVRWRTDCAQPAGRRCSGVAVATGCPYRRLVSRWFRTGEKPGDVDPGTVRRTGAAVRSRRQLRHLQQRRHCPPRTQGGRLPDKARAWPGQEVGSTQRAIHWPVQAPRKTLVRPPRLPTRRAPCHGDRRRPGRLRDGRQPGRTRLARDVAGAPCGHCPGSLGQSARSALPQALGPRHRAVALDRQRLRPHPPPARTAAKRHRLGQLRGTATGPRRQGSAAPGATGGRLPQRFAGQPRPGQCRSQSRHPPAGRRAVLPASRLGPPAGAVPIAGRTAERSPATAPGSAAVTP
ncbi:hypothetical protein FQZ97_761080 [compost metagenome]